MYAYGRGANMARRLGPSVVASVVDRSQSVVRIRRGSRNLGNIRSSRRFPAAPQQISTTFHEPARPHWLCRSTLHNRRIRAAGCQGLAHALDRGHLAKDVPDSVNRADPLADLRALEGRISDCGCQWRDPVAGRDHPLLQAATIIELILTAALRTGPQQRKDTSMPKAVIFDVDGTLVDTVALHARAWEDTFRHFGHEVPAERIRGQIGKGADQLMPVFVGGAEVAKQGKEMERFRADRFRERYLPHARAFPGVRELF